MAYEFSRIEKKWQNYWLENKTYKAVTGDKTRKKFYPLIEFPYPYKYTVSCTLRLPNGYAVEEVPKPQLLRTDNQQFACRYMIEHKENTVTMTYMFDLKGYQFPAEDYKQLQDIWTKVIEKNNELLVLKKL